MNDTGAMGAARIVELQIPPRRDYLAVARRFVTAAAPTGRNGQGAGHQREPAAPIG